MTYPKTRSLTRWILLAFLCSFIFSSIQAQNSGFIGHKFSAGVFTNFSPALLGPTPSNNGFDRYGEDSFTLGNNRMFGAYIATAIPGNREVVLNYERFTTGMVTDASTAQVGLNQSRAVFHELFYHLKVNTLHFQMRYYRKRKGAIAPVGAFIGVGIRLSQVNGEVVDKKSTFGGESVGTNHTALNLDDSFLYSTLTLELGKKFPITERVLCGASIVGGAPLTFLGLNTNYYYDRDYEPELYTENEFRYRRTLRMALYNLAQFRMSLSYLIF